MAKNATALKQAKAIFSTTATTLSLSGSDTDADSADDLELNATSISTESKKRKKEPNVLLSQLQQQRELIASLQQQLQQKDTCKPSIALNSYIAIAIQNEYMYTD